MALNNLGALHLQQENYPEALKFFQQAVEAKNTGSNTVKANLAFMYSKGYGVEKSLKDSVSLYLDAVYLKGHLSREDFEIYKKII